MIGRIKAAVKASMMQRKIEEYYYLMDEQYVGYHHWITEREAAYRSSIRKQEKKLTVQIVIPGELLTDVRADIYVFVTERRWLDEYAVFVIENYFGEYPECQVVYGDEDEWNSNRSIRMNPWFKPDFSPELLSNYFYFGNVVAVRSTFFHKNGGPEYLTTEALYEFCLRIAFSEKRERIGHVPYVLYHSPCIFRLCEGEAETVRKKALPYINSEPLKGEKQDRISIIIPSKDHPEVLETCLASIVRTCQEGDYEILVVDNGSEDKNRIRYEELEIKYGFKYIYIPMEFHFSKMCNLGAEQACGNILLFLNDDIEAAECGWMEHMKNYAGREHVGAVGVKLYYPDSKMIQHAGITNLRLGPVHKLQFLQDTALYYDGRNRIDHNVLAVTGACLMVRKDIFTFCGGFSEELAVAFNDVELCFRLYKEGYYNVVCNEIFLYHHESLSRGKDEEAEKQARLWKERKRMYTMHPDLYAKDPFYHPYLNTVILDTNYSFAYEYPAGSDVAVEEPKLLIEPLQQEWYNECLQISMEYAGELSSWMEGPEKKGEYLYFQGYQFVIGSDNPEYTRFILCEEEATKQIWKIPCIETYRPDLEKNIKEGYASLCGFSFVIEKEQLPKGRYRVGGMAKSRITRQVLCRFTNKYVEV